MVTAKTNKKTVQWLSSPPSGRRVLQYSAVSRPTPTQPTYYGGPLVTYRGGVGNRGVFERHQKRDEGD